MACGGLACASFTISDLSFLRTSSLIKGAVFLPFVRTSYLNDGCSTYFRQLFMTVYHWKGETFWLTKDRMMYWEEEQTLVAADIHIGKTSHFRKNGIAVPQSVFKEDMHRLFTSIQHFKPGKFVIVGDLFHSHANKDLDLFARWRNDFELVDFILVKGNHDILPDTWYAANNIKIVDCLEIKGLLMLHDKDGRQESLNDPGLKGIISGHVHPAVALRSGPRQQVRLPCFFFNHHQCILPAFSHFTGSYTVKPQKTDSVFAITKSEIMRIDY